MELQDILTYALGILMAIVGFLLKQLWSDMRENKDTQGKLKGKNRIGGSEGRTKARKFSTC